MALFALGETLLFPPVDLAEPDGLLAIGGDLSESRLLLAYRSGIFPWYEGRDILWWSPNPRFVLLPGSLKISKSMQQLLKRDAFEFTINQAFKEVIGNCKKVRRRAQSSTWITEELEAAFLQLHQRGFAHSAETWKDGQLVGGLYGIRIGKVFFGESMFSKQSNASKYAFIKYVRQLESEGTKLIDCQVYTEHLESLGAKMIDRALFLEALRQYC